MTARASMQTPIGMIEVEGVAGIVVAGDAALKAANVELLGWDSIGGYTTVFFAGPLSDVEAALRSGERAAREIVSHVVVAPLMRPEPACRTYISFPLVADAPVGAGALGLLETRGYGVHVRANDEMVKTAGVEVVNVLTVHNRVVCSLVRGDVGAVREAISVARQLLSGYAHLLCTAVIPQPEPDVLRAFGSRPMAAAGV